MLSGLMSVVTITIQTTNGDHPEQRQQLAEHIAERVRAMEAIGLLTEGVDEELLGNTAISIGTGVRQAGGG